MDDHSIFRIKLGKKRMHARLLCFVGTKSFHLASILSPFVQDAVEFVASDHLQSHLQLLRLLCIFRIFEMESQICHLCDFYWETYT
jgi:hypothetical protein